MRHEERCPNCGRFVEAEADGFYDREWPYHEEAYVFQFCNRWCADQKRCKDASLHGTAAWRKAMTAGTWTMNTPENEENQSWPGPEQAAGRQEAES